MLRQFSTKRIILTAAIDWLGTLTTLLVAARMRAGLSILPLALIRHLASFGVPSDYLQPSVFLMVALIWPVYLVLIGAYDGTRNATLKAELLNVFLAIAVATLTLAGLLFFTYRTTSRLLFANFFVLDLLLLLGVRVALWTYRLRLQGQPHPHRRQLLVVGAGHAGQAAVAQLQRYAWADVNLVGYVDDDAAKQGQVLEGAQVLGNLDAAARLAKAHQVQDAIVALPMDAHERLVAVCQALQQGGVHVHVIPDLFALSFPGAALEGFGGIPVIDLGVPGIYGWRRFWKRAFDLVLAAVGLVLISPLLGAIALLVRLEFVRAGALPPAAHRREWAPLYHAQIPLHDGRRRYRPAPGTRHPSDPAEHRPGRAAGRGRQSEAGGRPAHHPRRRLYPQDQPG